jgi:hypothetical protein
VLILICNASEPREDTKYSPITLMYNNTSKTSITCNMSELHQRNLRLCLLLFGGGGEGDGNHGRNRIVVLFISTYICNRYISQQMLGNL